MNYGMPYKGSKNKIAKKIIDVLPEAECFVDLFGGGGAMSHCAAMSGKYQKIIYNEIDPVIAKGFQMAINGKFKGENRWISREEFHLLKESDPYAAMCFSFANDLKSYCYSTEIEPWKKAVHYARAFDDYSKLAEFGITSDGSREDIKKNHKECKEKYIKWYLQNILNSQKTYEELKESLESLQRLESLERLERLESLQRLQSLERLERLQSLENIGISIQNNSYENVEIPENSVIYCDIPYRNTNKYKNEFDYDKFYNWCRSLKQTVYISEYQMPDDFIESAKFQKTCHLSATNNKRQTIEKLFKNR